MSFYKFDKNDTILNSARSYPEARVYIDQSASYFNNSGQSGYKPISHVSGSKLIVGKSSFRARPVFVSIAEYSGSNVTSSFELDYYTNSNVVVSSDYLTGTAVSYPTVVPNPKLSALKNTLNYYTKNSQHYAWVGPSSSATGPAWYKPEQDIMLVSIPSLLYGSSIQEGSVDLKFYVTGTLAGQLTDSTERGELVQSGGAEDGMVAGVVLYNEGFLLLTGSWDLNSTPIPSTGENPRWNNFATQSVAETDASFDISFNGTTYTPTMMMFAHANRGEVNNSNNPTFVEYDQTKVSDSSPFLYLENDSQTIKNIVSSSFQESGSFEKTTYISSIGIYDDNMNLVGTAKLANPIRKREKDSYTFKLKLDL